MTEEQRRQAAAQWCADLANKMGSEWSKEGVLTSKSRMAKVALNAMLEKDELARMIDHHFGHAMSSHPMATAARQHILPEPKPSPVERLDEAISNGILFDTLPSSIEPLLEKLGLELVEKSS